MGDSFDEVLHSCRRNSMKLAEFASQIGKLSPASPDDAVKASRLIPEAESECQVMERALGTLKHLAFSAQSPKRDALVSKYTNLEQEIGANARKPLAQAIKKYRSKEAESGARSTLLQRGQGKDNSVVIELGIQENASLRNSTSAFGGIEEQARGILQTLSTSGERLKGAQRKVATLPSPNRPVTNRAREPPSPSPPPQKLIRFTDVGCDGSCRPLKLCAAFCRQKAPR